MLWRSAASRSVRTYAGSRWGVLDSGPIRGSIGVVQHRTEHAVVRHAFSQVLHARYSRLPVEVTETRREKSGRPAVVVAYGPRSVPIMQIVEAAADRCEPVPSLPLTRSSKVDERRLLAEAGLTPPAAGVRRRELTGGPALSGPRVRRGP